MSFETSLSGLQAAATSLQVTGNNIANSQTVGFKESRAEFADVYASSMGIGNGTKNQPGSGVSVATVAQQFSTGNVTTTQNPLDMAINGNGFFVLANQINFPDPTNRNAPGAVATPIAYTRDGQFKLDSQGTVVNNQGQYLLAYAHGASNSTDAFSKGVFKPITVDLSQGAPKATTSVKLGLNLDVSKPTPVTSPFDRTDSTSYSNTTALTTYDSQGNAHVVSTYYVKDPVAQNTFQAYVFVDDFGVTAGTPATVSAALSPPATGGAAGTPIALTFDTNGKLNMVNGQAANANGVLPTGLDIGAIDLSTINPALKVEPLAINLDFKGTTQLNTPFSVNNQKQDGLAVGSLSGIDVDKDGVVNAHYTNGNTTPLGQVALARFNSNQSLDKLGDTTWGTSAGSGDPIYGTAGSNNFGSVQGSALESSNVDLSAQLVKLIVAQQAYQANAQGITTQKTLLETILRA